MQPETSIKEKLLRDFAPDEACPMGALLSVETPDLMDQADSKDNGSLNEVFPRKPSTFWFSKFLLRMLIFLLCRLMNL